MGLAALLSSSKFHLILQDKCSAPVPANWKKFGCQDIPIAGWRVSATIGRCVWLCTRTPLITRLFVQARFLHINYFFHFSRKSARFQARASRESSTQYCDTESLPKPHSALPHRFCCAGNLRICA